MKMHWCTARVNLLGQGFHTVWFSPEDAVSWPEVQVLISLHGEENVFDIKPVSIAEVNSRLEKDRLIAKYGMMVERVFPGRAFQMEMLMPAQTENLPASDNLGIPTGEHPTGNGGNGNGEDDEDDDQPAQPDQSQPAPAAFKPGKHPRPAAGV